MSITGTYLENPGQFPDPADGEPWGHQELWIDFAGGPYQVSGLNEPQLELLRDHFGEACIAPEASDDPAVLIRVLQLPAGHFRIPEEHPRLLDFDLEALEQKVKVSGEHLCGSIELTDGISGCLWTDRDDSWFTRNVFENYFRILVTYRLLETGGMLLHSAGIVSGDSAFLFTGRSGDGKSTLSRLSLAEGREVLSDDMNAVTWRGDIPWIEKVPFTGDLGRSWARSSSHPLGGLFAIRKAPETIIEDLPLTSTLSLLIVCTPYINADPFRLPQLMENLHKLTQTVPAHILSFSLSGEIWPLIEQTITIDGKRD